MSTPIKQFAVSIITANSVHTVMDYAPTHGVVIDRVWKTVYRQGTFTTEDLVVLSFAPRHVIGVTAHEVTR